MDELRYQLDLLKAMNQKLGIRERMYRLINNTVEGAFLYYSYDSGELTTLGKWEQLFDFEISDLKDIPKLYDVVDEPYILPLRELLSIEKTGKQSSFVDCLHRSKKLWLRVRADMIYDDSGRPTEKIISFIDITRHMQQNEELTYFAYYDGITGLYNRNYFVRLLGDFLKKAKEENEIISVMMIDIDDFHKINDGLGMVVGDEVVQQFGCFLKELSNDRLIACHLNSDVYCIAIYAPDAGCSVDFVHRAIKKRTKESFFLSGGQEIRLTVSIGVAEYPEAADSSLELINCAEIVMLKCKAMGKNSIQYFDMPILNDFLHSVDIENKLKDAVFHNSFELYYQPQYFAGNRKLRGVEALIRWKDAEQHTVSPSVFIPIAEKNGAILAIGKWVVEQSIRQYAYWRNRYAIDWVMSINVSPKQYAEEDFVLYLMRMLEKYHVRPENIELEITESILIDDFEAVSRKLHILRDNGIRISLDDFGTGFSSLSYLKRLPINTLKIDKSFIDTVLTDSATRVITESIIDMVKSLGIESIAEGVEEEQQYKYLHAIGCDVIQGYLLAKPMPADELEDIL
ncbi:MAG: bifunctional diguanylate cyclase/phosphodiesterase [Roseburia sp.]|nr:bifunctional diguanylate cyclase/phosphodiesterase [Roseburia sp.]